MATKQEQRDAAALMGAVAELQAPAVRRYAAESLEPLPQEGALRGEPNGDITMTLPDAVLTLRPPILGEYRVLAELPVGGEGEPIAWWRAATETLSEQPLPVDDECPVWLANPVYVRQAINHWLMRPTQAPGT